ncbi:MAG TPA: arsenate reductase ArsC [Gammaproteobacteria bacterium]|nr:arsenate reductase ArsC [Gammaproteobacteria bacterium]
MQMNLLFLCTGNSYRSQMAEGWTRQHGGDWLQVQSAGIESHGKNPRAIAVMQEVGVDISAQESTKLTTAMLEWADYVVTVCGHADEHCPVLSAGTRKEHWPLSDPAKATGTEEEIMMAFRECRDDTQQRVLDLIGRLKHEHAELIHK